MEASITIATARSLSRCIGIGMAAAPRDNGEGEPDDSGRHGAHAALGE